MALGPFLMTFGGLQRSAPNLGLEQGVLVASFTICTLPSLEWVREQAGIVPEKQAGGREYRSDVLRSRNECARRPISVRYDGGRCIFCIQTFFRQQLPALRDEISGGSEEACHLALFMMKRAESIRGMYQW